MINIKDINKKVATDLGVKNPMALPRLEKVVINVGAGMATKDESYLKEVIDTLTVISGQKPVVTRAKKAIAGFKIRENDKVGAMVTLRGQRMLNFVERLVAITLPRIRDFKGLSLKHFDKQGNYTVALKEQIIFPEIAYDKIKHNHGMQINFRINNSDRNKSKVLLTAFGMPFVPENKENNG